MKKNITFFGEINTESSASLIQKILQFSEECHSYNRSNTKEEGPHHLNIIFSSEGGCLEDAFAIYDVLQMVKKEHNHNSKYCKFEVNIYAVGKVMSAAVVVFLAGDHRKVGEHCSFMLHDLFVSFQISSGIENAQKELDYYKALRDKYAFLLSKKTNMHVELIENILSKKTDRYFSPQELMEYGIVHKVLDE
jgi:ATP-dependent protease ClpP protease subunit